MGYLNNSREAAANQREEGRKRFRAQVRESLRELDLREQYRAQGMSPAQAFRAAFYAVRGK